MADSSGVDVGNGEFDGSDDGVGDALCFRCLGEAEGLGEGVAFFFGVAVAFGDDWGLAEALGVEDGVGELLFVVRLWCFRAGVGVGVTSKNRLIFSPNDSSSARIDGEARRNSATNKMKRKRQISG